MAGASSTGVGVGVGEKVDTSREHEPRTGEPEAAHIVKFDGGDAVAQVLEARVYGTPVEALCGIVFVPQRDPTRLPLCGKCKEIYEAYRVYDGELPETPPS